MSKGAYVGVNGVARKIKKGYVGVGSIARKIKKAYIGVGGVARPCWSSGEVAYYGTAESLSTTTYYYNVVGASISNYGIFAHTSQIDAYDSSLTKTNATTLYVPSEGNRGLSATNNWDCAFFMVDSYRYRYLSKYDNSLTVTNINVGNGASTNLYNNVVANPNYLCIISGRDSSYTDNETGDSGYGTSIETFYYDSSMTKTSSTSTNSIATSLGNAVGCASVGDYALCAGGWQYTSSSSGGTTYRPTVYAIDSSLTRSTPSSLSSARMKPHGMTVGDNALFIGGRTSGVSNTVDIYNSALTRTTGSVSSSRFNGATTTNNGFGIIAGGSSSSTALQSNVELFDEALTRIIIEPLSSNRNALGAASVGNYFLIAGGHTTASLNTSYLKDDSVTTVDVYTVT